MNPEVLQRIRKHLSDYRQWCAGRHFTSCRLVQYCGPDLVAADVPTAAIETEIEGLLAEWFYVGWSCRGSKVYLKVWEFGFAEPDWEHVYAEKALPTA